MDIEKLYEALEWLENASTNIENYEKLRAVEILGIAKEQLKNAIKQIEIELNKED